MVPRLFVSTILENSQSKHQLRNEISLLFTTFYCFIIFVSVIFQGKTMNFKKNGFLDSAGNADTYFL